MPAKVFTVGGHTITGIPENTHYDVTEAPLSAADIAAGYSIGTMTGGSGTIPAGGSASASATNLFEGALLPARTVRFRFSDLSYDPSVSFVAGKSHSYGWTRVSSSPNVWDCHVTGNYSGDSWAGAFSSRSEYPDVDPIHFESYGLIVVAPGEYDYDPTKTITIVDANLTGVTSLNCTFQYCSQLAAVEKLRGTADIEDFNYAFLGCGSLSSVAAFDISGAYSVDEMFAYTGLEHAPAFDTSHIVDFMAMFVNCLHLREVPLYDTSSATDVRWMFYGCTSVASGALALYTQTANQATPPARHENCFESCGINTTTGAAELAQIPPDWK